MWPKLILIAILVSFIGLVAQRVWYYSAAVPERYEHTAAHAESLVSLGDDRYHVDAIFTSDGWLRLYTLGNDGRRLQEVEGRTLAAYLTLAGDSAAHLVELRPDPQTGDRPGRTSCFTGLLPAGLAGRSLQVSIPNLCIESQRFHLTFVRHAAGHAGMPAGAAADEETSLYLVPGGKYTAVDIEVNGRTVPSEKYRGFQARHDYDPRSGDQLCPVSRTKSNPACSWVIGGEVYQFCCPPCIDEFVRLAKTQPEDAMPPEAYVQP